RSTRDWSSDVCSSDLVGRGPVRLHRLGTTTWQRQRDKTRAAIRQMAIELLDLYARRQLAKGFAFPPDTPWQRELESAFLYEDTRSEERRVGKERRPGW